MLGKGAREIQRLLQRPGFTVGQLTPGGARGILSAKATQPPGPVAELPWSTLQGCSSAGQRGWETPPWQLMVWEQQLKETGSLCPEAYRRLPPEPTPHGFSVFLHPGPTGVCGFGGPYGETVATGAYRAFRVATAAGHCGAFSGGDSSRTSKSQGGNYAMPSPRASLPRLAPLCCPGPAPHPFC